MLRKIRRLLGAAEHVTAIVDEKIYTENEKSYAGGSLYRSNTFVVTNIQEGSNPIRLLNEILNIEKCEYIKNHVISNINKIESLIEAMKKNEEKKFNHIINWIESSSDENGIVASGGIKLLYHIMQTECNYFITNDICGTVCTAIINNGQDDISSEAEMGGMKSLISGLGYTMPKQKVIVNGVLAFKDVPVDEIAHTAIYLSSKYGQILTGEVLTMKNKQ